MESGNEKRDGNFRWTDDDVIVLCEVCINYLHKNGCGQTFKWHEIHKELEEKSKRKFQLKSLKNKFDSMRADWYMWKFLKNGETGLGWDPVSGKISASDEWWKKKIAVKPEAKKFRNKPLPPKMEDLYFHIFEGKRATEEGVVAPSIDPSSVRILNVEDSEVNDENVQEDLSTEYTQFTSRLEDLEGQEENFFGEFMKEITPNAQAPTLSQGLDNNFNSQIPRSMCSQDTVGSLANNEARKSGEGASKQLRSVIKKTSNPIQFKRRKRQSSGSAILSGHMSTMVNTCNRALEILEADVVSPAKGDTQGGSKDSSIDTAMEVVNDMVSECYLVKGSDLWCFLIHLLEDGVRRELFVTIDDHASRMAWLNFMQRREK